MPDYAMKSHRECAVICGGGTDPPLLHAENQKKEKYSCAEHRCYTESAFQAAFLPSYLLVDSFSRVSVDMFQPPSNKLALCMYILVLNLTLICSLILLQALLQILMSSPFLIYSPLELLFEEIGEEIFFGKVLVPRTYPSSITETQFCLTTF